MREEPIEIKHVKENTNIPLLLKSNIEAKISQIKSSDRPKIGYIHIGRIQVMIKAHFLEVINSLVNLAVLDNRIKDRKHVLGIIQENLSYKKLIFKIYPKYSISLRDRNINKTLTLCYDFKYFHIMHDGSYPYSITKGGQRVVLRYHDPSKPRPMRAHKFLLLSPARPTAWAHVCRARAVPKKAHQIFFTSSSRV